MKLAIFVLALIASVLADSITLTTYASTDCSGDSLASESEDVGSCLSESTSDCKVPDEQVTVTDKTFNITYYASTDKTCKTLTAYVSGTIGECYKSGRRRAVEACSASSVDSSAATAKSFKITTSSPASVATVSVVLLSAGALAALFV